ncbi:MAG: Na+/H+ antiporter subunit E [Acidimicrobiales bacterium]|nr:Na+/H+ antiporter subunit E [Acidimicrobiales bacterium]
MTRALTIAWLTVLWLLLWRDPSVANLLSGLAVSLVVTAGTSSERAEHRVRPLALASFVVNFAWKLVEANIILAREVVTPQNRIHTGIIAVSMAGYRDFVVTVVANAISLTPGTLTLEITHEPEPTIYVHVLHLLDLEDSRAEVEDMARRAGRAFPIIDRGGVPRQPEVSE